MRLNASGRQRSGQGECEPPHGLPHPRPSTHPWSSCTIGRAPSGSRCRTAHHPRRAAQRDRPSGHSLGGRPAGSQGTHSPCSPRQARRTRALSRCQARALYRALCRLRLDWRACSVQRLPARLVTTPQTVHSFTPRSSTGWLARSIRLRCYTCAITTGAAASRSAIGRRRSHRLCRSGTARASSHAALGHDLLSATVKMQACAKARAST